jgi:hypothetical protein
LKTIRSQSAFSTAWIFVIIAMIGCRMGWSTVAAAARIAAIAWFTTDMLSRSDTGILQHGIVAPRLTEGRGSDSVGRSKERSIVGG